MHMHLKSASFGLNARMGPQTRELFRRELSFSSRSCGGLLPMDGTAPKAQFG
jgi:hypothetical protein